MHPSPARPGFTLIELLIVIGIITVLTALAIPAILIARKHGTETRIRADLNTIAQAIDAYKADFHGQYPQFADPLSDQNANTLAIPGNGNWLDTDSHGIRGAALLARALIGPGPANTSLTSPNYPSNPGDDGADGPGFRVRVNMSGTTSGGTPIYNGKVYGPYLDAGKFKIQYINPPGSINPLFPQQFPVLSDALGNPILYYPAVPGNPPVNLGYTDPLLATTSASTRFNGYDNQYLLDSTSGGTTYSTTSDFAQLAVGAGAPEYLLWTSGTDGKFGITNGKSDDITNFDLPANLRK